MIRHVGHEVRAQIGKDVCACGRPAILGGRCSQCLEKHLDRVHELRRGDLDGPEDAA